jgi:hypothetical protein
MACQAARQPLQTGTLTDARTLSLWHVNLVAKMHTH